MCLCLLFWSICSLTEFGIRSISHSIFTWATHFAHAWLRDTVLPWMVWKAPVHCSPKVAKPCLLGWISLCLGLVSVAGPRHILALVPIENKDTGAHYKGVLYHHQMFHIIPWQNNASVFIMKTNWFGPVSILFAINTVLVFGGTLPTFPVLLAPTKALKADFHSLSVIRQWGLCKCGLIWAAVCFFCRGNLSLKNWEDEWVVPWAVFLLIWPSFTLDTTKESALVDGAHNSLVLMKAAWQLHKSLLDTTNRLLHTNL